MHKVFDKLFKHAFPSFKEGSRSFKKLFLVLKVDRYQLFLLLYKSVSQYTVSLNRACRSELKVEMLPINRYKRQTNAAMETYKSQNISFSTMYRYPTYYGHDQYWFISNGKKIYCNRNECMASESRFGTNRDHKWKQWYIVWNLDRVTWNSLSHNVQYITWQWCLVNNKSLFMQLNNDVTRYLQHAKSASCNFNFYCNRLKVHTTRKKIFLYRTVQFKKEEKQKVKKLCSITIGKHAKPSCRSRPK